MRSYSLYEDVVCCACLIVAFLLFIPTGGAAAVRPPYEASPGTVVTPPVIDGRLDEESWRQVRPATGFVQVEPLQGAPASECTEVWVLVDTRIVYVGVRAYDRDPEGIIVRSLRRDFLRLERGWPRLDEDAVYLVFDTFDDDRTGFFFLTNPAAAKVDAQIAEDGGDINLDWDGVWRVAAQVDEHGWSAEFAIPLSTLRFREGVKRWGFNVGRMIRRKNEKDVWAPIDRSYTIFRVSAAGTLENLPRLKPGHSLHVKPFNVAGGGPLAPDARVLAGLDVKYGVSPGLALDLTFNPDFSQVEVDQEQINLTRFPLFYPEKRDFFLENAGLFSFPVQMSENLFYSRRIGLTRNGDIVPLWGGARLTGKVGRFRVGMLTLRSRAGPETPGTTDAVVRVQRDWLARSSVGFLVTSRTEAGGGYGHTYAADATWRFTRSGEVRGYLATTDTPGELGNDWSYRLGINYNDNRYQLIAYRISIGEAFDPVLGFLRRRGVEVTLARAGLKWRPAVPLVREVRPIGIFYLIERPTSGPETRIQRLRLDVDFQDGSGLSFTASGRFERLLAPFDIHPRVRLPVGDYAYGDYRLSYMSDPSDRFWMVASFQWGGFFDGTRRLYRLEGGVRPSPHLQVTGSYERNAVELGPGAFSTDLVGLKVNYSVSTSLYVAAFVQYNSLTDQVVTNLRANFIHRPLSDLYVVYLERRPLAGGPVERSLVTKFSYLFDW